MITAPLLNLIQESGESVLVLTDDIDEASFARSRLTRAEVRRHVQTLAATLEGLGAGVEAQMPEIDWDGWRGVRRQLQSDQPSVQTEGLWFAVQSLVPATLSWLRVYRQSQPEMFSAWE